MPAEDGKSITWTLAVGAFRIQLPNYTYLAVRVTIDSY